MKYLPEFLLVAGASSLGAGVFLLCGLPWLCIETGILLLVVSIILARGRN